MHSIVCQEVFQNFLIFFNRRQKIRKNTFAAESLDRHDSVQTPTVSYIMVLRDKMGELDWKNDLLVTWKVVTSYQTDISSIYPVDD